MKTILVPFDFSAEAHHAFEFAKALASKTGNHLKLLHVIELPAPQSINTFGEVGMQQHDINHLYTVEIAKKRKEQLEAIEELVKDEGFKFTTKIVYGNPFAGIAQEIAEIKADLVVIGSKGSSGVEEVLIGSNTEKVVRLSKCPVITIKNKVLPSQISKIVFASDFENESSELAQKLNQLKEVVDADLHLVKINTPSLFENSRRSLEKMKTFAEKFGIQATSLQIYNSSSEEEGIIEFADDINADMIAMATHGRTGFMHLLSGSIAEDVVNHAKRPVWTFKVK
jgi:nucleotide-binding universal stress UspA family protein